MTMVDPLTDSTFPDAKDPGRRLPPTPPLGAPVGRADPLGRLPPNPPPAPNPAPPAVQLPFTLGVTVRVVAVNDVVCGAALDGAAELG
jgi:hypothetical protein